MCEPKVSKIVDCADAVVNRVVSSSALRSRLAQLLLTGLDRPAGFVLPLRAAPDTHQSADGVIEHLSRKTTYAVYMPGYGYAAMSARLVAAGLSTETPCAIVSQVATPGERVFRTTLGELPNAPQLPSPTLLFVGEVVRMAAHSTLESEAAWWTPESFREPAASIDLAAQDFGTQQRARRGD